MGQRERGRGREGEREREREREREGGGERERGGGRYVFTYSRLPSIYPNCNRMQIKNRAIESPQDT